VGRVEVLHQDEGHAGIGRQGAQEFPAGVKAARRGADADDDNVSGVPRRQGMSGSRSGRFGRMLAAVGHSRRGLPIESHHERQIHDTMNILLWRHRSISAVGGHAPWFVRPE
jgi:hypothetical protein